MTDPYGISDNISTYPSTPSKRQQMTEDTREVDVTIVETKAGLVLTTLDGKKRIALSRSEHDAANVVAILDDHRFSHFLAARDLLEYLKDELRPRRKRTPRDPGGVERARQKQALGKAVDDALEG